MDLSTRMDLAALRRWWPLAAVVGLLFAASLAATRSAPRLERIPPKIDVLPTSTRLPTAPDVPTVEPTGPGAAGEAADGLPAWVDTAVLVGLAVLLAAIAGLVVWAVVRDQLRRRDRRGRRSRTLEAPPSTADDLVAALDAGLLDLSDTDRDPRRAVIACWLRLEQAAAAAGTPRQPGDTPGDLVGRLLAEQRVDAAVLADLAAVYREARYATHAVDERMRADARHALQRLRADLAAGARVAAGTPG
jgi:hypothetical protein